MIALVAAVQFLLPIDSSSLRRAAIRESVPPVVMYAIAWQESRTGSRLNDYLGPGREQCDPNPPGLCRRVCREIGRGQINPCGRWASLAQCRPALIKHYHANLRCMATILRRLYDLTGSWPLAMKSYNGSGPMADSYLTGALAYLGWYTLSHGP